jgi:hypothetical protein
MPAEFRESRSREGFLLFLTQHGGACLQAARHISRDIGTHVNSSALLGDRT